ncbi:MAG: hypothetical protein IT454_05705 [Planctomycetes bacterium]|nr:hypothetical protein [Planctomycetota bacterium]
MLLLSLFAALFLLLLAGLAFASVKLFGAKDAQGQLTAPGCLNGCMAGLMLSVIAALGLGAFVVGAWTVSAADALRTVVESAPDMKVGVWHDRPTTLTSIPGYPLHVVLQWAGHSEPTEQLLKKLEELGAGTEMRIDVSYDNDETDGQRTTVDIAIPMSPTDANELSALIESLRSELKLEQGVEVLFSRVEPLESSEVR